MEYIQKPVNTQILLRLEIFLRVCPVQRIFVGVIQGEDRVA